MGCGSYRVLSHILSQPNKESLSTMLTAVTLLKHENMYQRYDYKRNCSSRKNRYVYDSEHRARLICHSSDVETFQKQEEKLMMMTKKFASSPEPLCMNLNYSWEMS